jgi:hypothetical protein
MTAQVSARGVSTVLPVPAERAFHLLEAPSSLQHLVAGARRIRSFDTHWPEPGTRIHHSVGIGPLVIRDHSEVLEVDPPRLLRLDAHIWPMGTLIVEFRFEDHPDGCRFTVAEAPDKGPVSWPGLRRLTRLGVMVRNREVCRRYRKMAETRLRAGWEPAGA